MTKTMILSNRLPWPLEDGWRVRAFHVTRAIARASSATLVTYGTEGAAAQRAFASALDAPLEVHVLPRRRGAALGAYARSAASAMPLHAWMQDTRELSSLAGRLRGANTYENLVIYQTLMYPVARRHFPDARLLIDTHNVDSSLYGRYAASLGWSPRGLYSRLMARQFHELEGIAFRDADCIWTCSSDEIALVRNQVSTARTMLVPNGVDIDKFRPQPASARAADTLVFFGRLDYVPNEDAVRFLAAEIMPRVRAARPDATLRLVGVGAGPSLQRLADRTDGCELVGRVPDIRIELQTAGVVVVPLRAGSGTRLKIIEALAMGCPLVATTIGAEGLDLVPGEHYLRADSAADFADAVVRLCADRALAQSLGDAGRRFVETRYDWARLEGMIQQGLRNGVKE